jgi:adenylate cyclase class 2
MEIEAKFRLTTEQFHAIQETIGQPDRTVQEWDTYFHTPEPGTSLRVRRQHDLVTLDRVAWITLKGGRNEVGGIMAIDEVEPEIPYEMATVFEKMFPMVGLATDLLVAKTRRMYNYQGATLVLDTVEGLGYFAEVEIISDDASMAMAKLGKIVLELGFDKLEKAAGSYRWMMQQGAAT